MRQVVGSPAAVEAAFHELINTFDSERIAESSVVSTAAPIFICGMFRSGSTLVEQLLARHPSISAGGELDFLPWLVAATVRSLNHVRSLATVEHTPAGGGERHERIIHVEETRLTGLAIHLLIGGSLLLLPVLRLIPMAVLYGIFLYMGIVSMHGNQFFERLSA